jgi:hypothetical protein
LIKVGLNQDRVAGSGTWPVELDIFSSRGAANRKQKRPADGDRREAQLSNLAKVLRQF